jgi:mono/diheme cytochrome c family protein
MTPKWIAALMLPLVLLTSDADAGTFQQHRCTRAAYHNLHSSQNWSTACYACHQKPATDDYGWRGQLLDIAKEAQRFSAAQNRAVQEHQDFLTEVEALGLTGNFKLQAYAAAGAYGLNVAGQESYQPYAQQGSTVYGYSSVAESYGNLDLAALYNQAGRLAEQSLNLSSNATGGFQSLVSAEGAQRAEVARIIAQGQSAREALLAAKADPQSANIKREFRFEATVGQDGRVNLQQKDVGSHELGSWQALAGLIGESCLKCHNDEKRQGGLSLARPEALTVGERQAVLSRIVHTDPAKRMPLAADGSPGRPLSVEDIQTWFQTLQLSPTAGSTE